MASVPLEVVMWSRTGIQRRQRLGEILVPAAGEADHIKLAVGVLQRPSQGVGALKRRDDSLQACGAGEGGQRLGVVDGDVASPALVAQPGVLGTGSRVIEPGRDRVGL